MRLSPSQTEAIVAAARAVLGSDVRVTLFGSRLDDQARGGDIDLLLEVPQAVDSPAWLAARVTARVQQALGDRKIDVLLLAPDTAPEPVHHAALLHGVRLA
jgi:predicted nucleotidyltransferase